jgi:hypothetical protein
MHKSLARSGRRKKWLAAASLTLLFQAPGMDCRAAVILFTASNLTDTTPGEDLWLYQYRVSDFAFGAGQGFSITFDRDLFTKLQSPPTPVNGGWNAITLQPDLALSSHGLYDAQALGASPSLANDFQVTAVWLGTGSPGSQAFTLYDLNFSPLAQGQTVAAVPEPATSFLLASGLVLVALRLGQARKVFRP